MWIRKKCREWWTHKMCSYQMKPPMSRDISGIISCLHAVFLYPFILHSAFSPHPPIQYSLISLTQCSLDPSSTAQCFLSSHPPSPRTVLSSPYIPYTVLSSTHILWHNASHSPLHSSSFSFPLPYRVLPSPFILPTVFPFTLTLSLPLGAVWLILSLDGIP